MPNDLPDWGDGEITTNLAGSVVCSPSSSLFLLGGAYSPRFFIATWSVDTSCLVQIGPHVGPGTAPTTVIFEAFLAAGIPWTVQFPPAGWYSSVGQVQWAVTLGVSGASLAYTIWTGL